VQDDGQGNRARVRDLDERRQFSMEDERKQSRAVADSRGVPGSRQTYMHGGHEHSCEGRIRFVVRSIGGIGWGN